MAAALIELKLIITIIPRDIKIEMDLQLVEQENNRGILGKNYLDFR